MQNEIYNVSINESNKSIGYFDRNKKQFKVLNYNNIYIKIDKNINLKKSIFLLVKINLYCDLELFVCNPEFYTNSDYSISLDEELKLL